MFFNINPQENVPIYKQIVQQIKEMRVKGIMQPNDKLPSVRELSSHMILNPATVSRAYSELEKQGIIMTIQGKGTYIAEQSSFDKNKEEIAFLQSRVKKLIVDSYYHGVTIKELHTWLDECEEEIGGDSSER